MTITKLQYRILKAYQANHYEGVQVGRWIRSGLGSWALLIGVSLVCLYFSVVHETSGIGWLAVGFTGGCVLRDIQYFRQSAMIWSLIEHFTVWSKIDELVAEYERNPPQGKGPLEL